MFQTMWSPAKYTMIFLALQFILINLSAILIMILCLSVAILAVESGIHWFVLTEAIIFIAKLQKNNIQMTCYFYPF